MVDVLLVEPDEVMAGRYSQELAVFDARVHVAASQAAAVQCVSRQKLECVFIDLEPSADVDHEALMRCIRSSPSNAQVPIVVLCANEELLPLARACRAGATHYLLKPIVRPQLKRLMRAIHPSLVQQRRQYQRAAMAFPVLCRHGDTENVASSINLSASGMLMTEAPDLAEAEELQVEFPFDQEVEDPFVLKAVVARRNTGNQTWAVSFADTPTDEFDRLKLWVEMSLTGQPGRTDN